MQPKHSGAAHVALLILLVSCPDLASGQMDTARTIDLDAALELAREQSPLLETARARIQEAQGGLTQASLLLADNPQLEFSAGPRFPSESGGSELDAEAGVAQRFETGGQRRHRVARAQALERAARAESADVDRVVSQAVAAVFFEALGASEQLRLSQENAALAESLYDISNSRVSAGAAAPLEENTARIRRAKATRQLIRDETQLLNAKLTLATALGIDSKQTLRLEGSLPGAAALPPLVELLALAERSHPRLLASRATLEAQQSASALAEADAWPDLSIGASYAREEEDDIVKGGLSVEIPLFNRNQGERERAKAVVRRATAASRSARLEVGEKLRRSYANYDAATRSVAAFDSDVLRSHRENLKLIEAMYQAGKIQYIEVVLLQRELLEGRLGYLDARLELALAQIATRAAAGLELTSRATPRNLP
jgi:cobalt-zinc-cadmium efflux system outer membrane protein